jgi:hypothetical protein
MEIPGHFSAEINTNDIMATLDGQLTKLGAVQVMWVPLPRNARGSQRIFVGLFLACIGARKVRFWPAIARMDRF